MANRRWRLYIHLYRSASIVARVKIGDWAQLDKPGVTEFKPVIRIGSKSAY
jgi:hypothetical protein